MAASRRSTFWPEELMYKVIMYLQCKAVSVIFGWLQARLGWRSRLGGHSHPRMSPRRPGFVSLWKLHVLKVFCKILTKRHRCFSKLNLFLFLFLPKPHQWLCRNQSNADHVHYDGGLASEPLKLRLMASPDDAKGQRRRVHTQNIGMWGAEIRTGWKYPQCFALISTISVAGWKMITFNLVYNNCHSGRLD